MGFGKDNWHREIRTRAELFSVNPRRWGMRVTVYDDGALSGDYVLTPGKSSLIKSDNGNWTKVADLDAPWGNVAVGTETINGFTAQAYAIWRGPAPSLTYDVSWPDYYIDRQRYLSGSGFVTLANADPTNPRIDAIALNNLGQLIVIPGTANANPEFPTYDPTTQIIITYVLVPAGATSPQGVSDFVIYNENAGVVATNVPSLNAANTVNPLVGSICIDALEIESGQYIDFNLPAAENILAYTNFKLPLLIRSQWRQDQFFNIQLFNDSTPVTNAVPITSGAFNFSRFVLNTYQIIVVPVSAFTFSSNLFNRVRLSWGSNIPIGDGFKIDYFVLQASDQQTVNIGNIAAAGSNQQVQFNASGLLGASSSFRWDNIFKQLTVGQLGLPRFVTLRDDGYLATSQETPSTNTEILLASFGLWSQGTPAANFGGRVEYGLETTTPNIAFVALGLRYRWQTVNQQTRIAIQNLFNGSANESLIINGKNVGLNADPTPGAGSGNGNGVTKIGNADIPPNAGAADACLLYSKDVAGSSELFVRNEAGVERKLSGPSDKTPGTLILCGLYDASTDQYPASGGTGSGGVIEAGNVFINDGSGTIEPFDIAGAWLIALVDNPAQTSTNWQKLYPST